MAHRKIRKRKTGAGRAVARVGKSVSRGGGSSITRRASSNLRRITGGRKKTRKRGPIHPLLRRR